MKVIHLLLLGLIGFIVYRLTQSVEPPAPEPEPRSRVEIIQTTAPSAPERAPVAIAGSDAPRNNGNETESLLRQILHRLTAPAPAPATAPGAPPVPTAPTAIAPDEPPAVAGATPGLRSDRERMRISQDRRLELIKLRGTPKYYRGILRRYMDADTILVKSSEVGECLVDEFVPTQRMADGSIIVFEAWTIGTKTYTSTDRELHTALHMIYAAPQLPMWDKYGKPINRDVLSPEAVRAAGLHGETMLDRKVK